MRDRLVDAARELLDEQGLEGVTLRNIARRAGVSHGAPLRHYAGLSSLLAAVAADGFVRLMATIDEELAGMGTDGDAWDRLRAAGRGYVRFAVTNPGAFGLMFRAERVDVEYPDYRKHGGAAFDQLVTLVEAVQAEGFRRRDPPRALAASVWAGIHGVAQLWLHGALLGVTPDVSLDEHVARMQELLFAGLSGRKRR